MVVLILGGSGMLGHKVWQTFSPRANRTTERGEYYIIQPILPELSGTKTSEHTIGREYSSADNQMSSDEVTELLRRHNLMGDRMVYEEEIFE